MSSSLRRGALAASAIVFSIASLAACGAGNNAQTLEIKPDNAATSVGDIKVQNALVITQPDLQSTGPAVVSATVFNSGKTDQTLQSITLDGSGTSAELKPAKGQSLTVPAHGSLILGGKDNASATLPSGREAVQDGNAQKITFTFSKTGKVSLRAFVVPATSYFDKWGPSQVPSAPAGAGGATAAPSGSASASGGKPGSGHGTSPSATASGAAATPHDSASASAAGH
ncbi:copper chaperone PCu(A)C [Streptomyces spinosus]|uniref:copper chaperone PCu(A)C n=1 Tax=Streptomyces spinosus TaxID=2872623 RepID=UPI001CED80B9|nr:copper chaperone PCu(A)C [Streptomyces spinosus]